MQLNPHTSRHIAHLAWETPVHFYTSHLVHTWHCRTKPPPRHSPNCPRSNPSPYVDPLQEISPRTARQPRPSVKLHHPRRKCKNGNPGTPTNGPPAMKNPDAPRTPLPQCFGGKYKPLKKHNSRRTTSQKWHNDHPNMETPKQPDGK